MNVEGNSLKEVNIIQNDVSFTEVVCLGNKGNIIMLADMEANIALIDTKKNTTQIYQNKGQQIKSIKFGPSSGNPLVAIIFSESFQIWNSASLTILFDSNRITGSVVIDIDWVSTNLLIIAFGDGTVQIIDILKGQPNVAENNLYHKNTFTPFFITYESYLTFKSLVLFCGRVMDISNADDIASFLSKFYILF
uniref:WD repeat-containing protein 11 (Trinotate prediction) n=1 Tax=Henneguya salminicola TaxID=69463 RepID=A0A6G3MFV7_HENSL